MPSSGRAGDDVEKAYHELKKKGVDFRSTHPHWPGEVHAILKDPDGDEFEIS